MRKNRVNGKSRTVVGSMSEDIKETKRQNFVSKAEVVEDIIIDIAIVIGLILLIVYFISI